MRVTDSIYEAVGEASSQPKHRIRVSRVLKILGVSRSGYYDWLRRKPSHREKQKAEVKRAIKDIYDPCKRIYGASKITAELHKTGSVVI